MPSYPLSQLKFVPTVSDDEDYGYNETASDVKQKLHPIWLIQTVV